ncbi:hypothetical protein CPC08DRAFT_716913 [Agrocybe pediades]|nr:hypothetical protein CPC08DRAFT_716913 [Agrocybe pediades]
MSVAAPEALAVFDAYLAIQASRYAHLSAGVIILYDHVITLDQEVSLVWQEPLSLGKILFLSNRYCAFFTTMYVFYSVMSPPNLKSFCTQVYRWQGWTSIVITILAQAILQLRIYALYSKNKRILIAMSILFIVSVSASALITSEILSRLTGVLYPIPPLGQFCLQNRVKLRIYYTFWIPAMAFDVFLSVLTISKSFKLRKSLATSVFCQTGEKLVDVFFRDSAIYFVVITATYITCMLVWIIGAVRTSSSRPI